MKQDTVAFLCRCGDNIAGVVDFEKLRADLEQHPSVCAVAEHNLLCSPDGKSFVADAMRENGGTHAVVVGCSPKDHERDFHEALAEAGVNPYMLQMANVREHCTWVTRDPDKAYAKTIALTRAALRRVEHHEALRRQEIDCIPDILVIGGGVAGIEAALAAAEAGRKVTLVEASPSIGGRVAEIEDVAPNMECGACLLAPRLDAVAEHDNIDLLTNATVDQIVGFLGNFSATITQHGRLVVPDNCIGCDECMQVCPVEVDNDFDHKLGKRKAIYLPFPGAVPNCAIIDTATCVRFHGETCTMCATACPLEAVDFAEEDRKIAVQAGAVVLATGCETFDPSGIDKLGYGRLPDVYTLGELERLYCSTGPTEGAIVRRDGSQPKEIAAIHCVGRKELGYCSGSCCTPALKVAAFAHHKDPDCRVTHLMSDMVAPTWASKALQDKATGHGSRFLRVQDPSEIRIEGDDAAMQVTYPNAAGTTESVSADMVVLVTGLRPNAATGFFADMLYLIRDDSGFLAADHPLLRAAQTSVDGVYLAGTAAGPRSIGDSIASAHAAAGLALAKIQPGRKLTVEVLTAQTDEALCSSCMICTSVCPYRACTANSETDCVTVNEILCRGCGVCAASCPSGAARARHFTDRQLMVEIEEVLRA